MESRLRLAILARRGPLAQLVEQGTLNPKVGGSNPPRPMTVLSAERTLHVSDTANEEGRWGNAGVTQAAPDRRCALPPMHGSLSARTARAVFSALSTGRSGGGFDRPVHDRGSRQIRAQAPRLQRQARSRLGAFRRRFGIDPVAVSGNPLALTIHSPCGKIAPPAGLRKSSAAEGSPNSSRRNSVRQAGAGLGGARQRPLARRGCGRGCRRPRIQGEVEVARLGPMVIERRAGARRRRTSGAAPRTTARRETRARRSRRLSPAVLARGGGCSPPFGSLAVSDRPRPGRVPRKGHSTLFLVMKGCMRSCNQER
jgi:hypothetical protein